MIHNNLQELFADCAEAIRSRDNTTGQIVADNFPERIRALANSDILHEHDGVALIGRGNTSSSTVIIGSGASRTESVAAYDSSGSSGVDKNRQVYFSIVVFTGPYTTYNRTNVVALGLTPNKVVTKEYDFGDIKYKVEAVLTTNASVWVNNITITNLGSSSLTFSRHIENCCIYN